PRYTHLTVYPSPRTPLSAFRELSYGPADSGSTVSGSRSRLYTRSHMDVHLIDGTYELFRHFFGAPAALDASGRQIGAVRGVLRSVLSMIERGATHLGVATDHVIESFRNGLYSGYKTSAGVPEELMSQFPIL